MSQISHNCDENNVGLVFGAQSVKCNSLENLCVVNSSNVEHQAIKFGNQKSLYNRHTNVNQMCGLDVDFVHKIGCHDNVP